jgi:uncharacterized protein YbjT (DUF2867 family)
MTIEGPILVTGGTATLGRALTRRLLDAGKQVRVLSRQPRPADADLALNWVVADLTTGAGLESAVRGAGTVIHCASDGRTPGADIEAASRLLAAARGGRPHVVYVSIVGVDRVPLRYYREKLAVEQLVERSGLPWTVLRATQFHDLLLTMFQRLSKLPVMAVPAGTSFQPVDVTEVAAQLVRFASGPPVGRATDLGGPQVRTAADLARSYLRSRGRRRPVLPVRLPGKVARAYRAGGHLAPGQRAGGRTWEQFLAETVR